MLGARNSFKTLSLAVSEALDLIFSRGSIIHVGSIDRQAQKCYSYVRKFLFPNYAEMVKDSLMSRTRMVSGNELEIIPCTMNRVNGPHESKVRFDEVELANQLAYQDAKGMPVSNFETGEPPSICYTSTRKYIHGLFAQEMKRMSEQNKPIVTFCYKDVSEGCSNQRSGTSPVPIWVDRTNLTWSLTKEKQEHQQFMVWDGCLRCPIVPSCLGDLKNAHGIIPINDSIIRFTSSTPEFWIAQAECRKPARKGLMIYSFDEAISAVKINWSMFMTREGKFDTSRFMFVGGKDFNYSPDATLAAVIDKHFDTIYFVKEFSYSMKTIPDICGDISDQLKRMPFGPFEDIQCDKSEPGLIDTMRAYGLDMAQAVEESDVEGGCDLLNFLAKPPHRPTMMYVDRELCPTFIWEMSSGYVRKMDPNTGEPGDDPNPKNNHFVDCARYIVWKYLKHCNKAYGQYSDAAPNSELEYLNAFSSTPQSGHNQDDLLVYLASLGGKKR